MQDGRFSHSADNPRVIVIEFSVHITGRGGLVMKLTQTKSEQTAVVTNLAGGAVMLSILKAIFGLWNEYIYTYF